MSWEITLFLSVLVVCLTIYGVFSVCFAKENTTSSLELEESFEELDERLSQIEKDHASVLKLAEDTKKLLSEGNLIRGLRPQR